MSETPYPPAVDDELGAHVSVAGGVVKAPGRAREIASQNVQIFTKQPNRWAEPTLDEATTKAFREERERLGIRVVVSHDSYLINLSSPDPDLHARSYASFVGELRRCVALGVDFLVTHPGNATDGDHAAGLARNAESVARAIAEVPGETIVLLELTAGSGTTVGGTFEDLAALLAALPEPSKSRVGVCFDTCHAWVGGYDLANDWDGVWSAFDATVGLDRLRLFHCNDAKFGLGSHRDRHAGLGEGTLGEEPFRRLMLDPRFAEIPKLLETPKGDEPVENDLRNLGFLRAFRE